AEQEHVPDRLDEDLRAELFRVGRQLAQALKRAQIRVFVKHNIGSRIPLLSYVSRDDEHAWRTQGVGNFDRAAYHAHSALSFGCIIAGKGILKGCYLESRQPHALITRGGGDTAQQIVGTPEMEKAALDLQIKLHSFEAQRPGASEHALIVIERLEKAGACEKVQPARKRADDDAFLPGLRPHDSPTRRARPSYSQRFTFSSLSSSPSPGAPLSVT